MATPEIVRIPTSYQDVISLLRSAALRAVEESVAAQTRMTLLPDESTAKTTHLQGDMSVCGMTAAEIQNLLASHPKQIISFGVAFLRDKNGINDLEEFPEGEEQEDTSPKSKDVVIGLGQGCGITYAIYYHFLLNRTPAEFKAYLKNRRMPRHTIFASELRRIFEKSQADC